VVRGIAERRAEPWAAGQVEQRMAVGTTVTVGRAPACLEPIVGDRLRTVVKQEPRREWLARERRPFPVDRDVRIATRMMVLERDRREPQRQRNGRSRRDNPATNAERRGAIGPREEAVLALCLDQEQPGPARHEPIGRQAGVGRAVAPVGEQVGDDLVRDGPGVARRSKRNDNARDGLLGLVLGRCTAKGGGQEQERCESAHPDPCGTS
jgi:hypothetical protein